MPLVVGSESFSPEQHHQKYLEGSDGMEHKILYLLISNTTLLILTLMNKDLQMPEKKGKSQLDNKVDTNHLNFVSTE